MNGRTGARTTAENKKESSQNKVVSAAHRKQKRRFEIQFCFGMSFAPSACRRPFVVYVSIGLFVRAASQTLAAMPKLSYLGEKKH